jgi:hypothetical protein
VDHRSGRRQYGDARTALSGDVASTREIVTVPLTATDQPPSMPY